MRSGPLLLLLLAGCTGHFAPQTVPLFMWSEGGHFRGSGCGLSDTVEGVVNGGDVLSGVKGFFRPPSEASKGGLVADPRGVGAVVAFVVDELSTSKAAQLLGAYKPLPVAGPAPAASPLGYIREQLNSHGSCVSAPFVASEKPLSSLIVSALPENTQALEFRLDDNTACDDVVALLGEKRAAFGEGAALVLVRASSSQLDASCMKSISSAVERVATGAVVTVFASDSAGPSSRGSTRRVLLDAGATRQLLGAADSNGDYPGVLYTSPTVVFGIMFMWFFIFFVFLGVNCLMQIETPQRFAPKALSIAKEY